MLAFTFSSLFKGKANLATLIVFLICGLLAPPLFFLFGGSGTSAPAEHELSRVAVYNETELPVGEILSDREDPQFADVLFEEGASEYAADPAGALGPKEAAVRITREASGAYQADLYAAEETELSDTELEQLSGWFQSAGASLPIGKGTPQGRPPCVLVELPRKNTIKFQTRQREACRMSAAFRERNTLC